ncbi:MAG: hypothetical protein VKJ87_01025 [Synechococcus sp.]|nr:hypothetical protein [Synechococcus sp.]
MGKKSSSGQAKSKPQQGVVDDTLKQRFKNQPRSTTPVAGDMQPSSLAGAAENPGVDHADLELRGQQLRGDR